MDILQPDGDPKIFKLKKMKLLNGDKELEIANPNNEVILSDL